MTQVPLFKCDLDDDVLNDLAAVFKGGALATGAAVVSLEKQMGELLGRDCVSMSDSTHALTLALSLAGVGAGSDVLTLSFNCLGSTTPIKAVGATPVWVDVQAGSVQMNVDDVRNAITPTTRAIVVYHIAGYPAPMSRLRDLAREAGLPLIEDANAALGARAPEGLVGTFGDFGVVSFYANRLVNGVDGAILACGNPEDADRARKLRRYGVDAPAFRDKWGEIDPSADVPQIGMYAPMSNVNATVALRNLAQAEGRLLKIRDNARILTQGLKGVGGVRPVPAGNGEPSFWAYLVLAEERDKLLIALKRAGVNASKLHHPNHLYSGFEGRPRVLPGTVQLADQLIALPCGWWVSHEDVKRMVSLIADFYSGR